MKKFLLAILSILTGTTGCLHSEPPPPDPVFILQSPTLDERTKIADETCEVQYQQDKQNFLSAVQTVIRDRSSGPDLNLAPLETFREEINAAYNAVVMRCKTHMHCLEVKDYNEAACYMAATDRKDAERRFSDLSRELREIERDIDRQIVIARGQNRPGPNVNVTTTVEQQQTNKQTNDNHNGDDIADQDVLVLCGNADNLLDRRCRKPCGRCR